MTDERKNELWERFAADGGVFAYGSAGFRGSATSLTPGSLTIVAGERWGSSNDALLRSDGALIRCNGSCTIVE